MIQLLDLQDIEEDTEGNGKENKEEDKSTPKHKNIKSDNKDVLKSLNSKDKHILDSAAKDITKVEQENTKEYRPESQSEKEATEETLSWFAGACHVWQSSVDEQQNELQYTPSNSKERKGLWPRLSSVNFFGLNISKNLDTQQKPSPNTNDKSKYFWQLQKQKQCECKSNLKPESGGRVYGWANIGFNEDLASSSCSQTKVVELKNKDFRDLG